MFLRDFRFPTRRAEVLFIVNPANSLKIFGARSELMNESKQIEFHCGDYYVYIQMKLRKILNLIFQLNETDCKSSESSKHKVRKKKKKKMNLNYQVEFLELITIQEKRSQHAENIQDPFEIEVKY